MYLVQWHHDMKMHHIIPVFKGLEELHGEMPGFIWWNDLEWIDLDKYLSEGLEIWSDML